jgi:hypothetical protein
LYNHGENLSAGEIAKLLMMRRRGAAGAIVGVDHVAPLSRPSSPKQ